MIRRLFRLVAIAASVAGAAAAVRALTRSNDPLPSPATPSGEPWPPPTVTPPAPAPTEPTPEEVTAPEPGGVPVADDSTPEPESTPLAAGAADPTADGDCPSGYPIKANLKSGIFHAPGQLNYDRTTPDRCYTDAAAAEADGLRAAKR